MRSGQGVLPLAMTLIIGCGGVGERGGASSETQQPLISGSIANQKYTGVAALGTYCSAVLVAPRVMLTSAHCIDDHATGCVTLPTNALSVTFAEPAGGWTSQAAYDGRTIAVQDLAVSPGIFDLTTCSAADTYHCGNVDRAVIDHSSELVVLFLAADAPADAVALPVLINPSVPGASDMAAEVGVFPGLASWVEANEPVVTTVGYGIGSQGYSIDAGVVHGRDYGVQRWIDASTNFSGGLGAADCNTLAASTSKAGVLTSPDDLTSSMVGVADHTQPGVDFAGASHSHSGTGDSGGPILIGTGSPAKGVSPTPLPAPGPSADYDLSRNYVAGTASIWVNSGQTLRTAFTPSWTVAASSFLAGALHDTDGDGLVDRIDDDVDGDGCNNAVDQHPNDASARIGVVLHPNCHPQSTTWYGSEGVDSDGDGTLDCAETDDDNDGTPDESDLCPTKSSGVCVKAGNTCPFDPLFFNCRLGGCSELLLRITSVINPDPTRSAVFDVRSIMDRSIGVAPLKDRALSYSADVLAGRSLANSRSPVQMELVGVRGQSYGVVAMYEPASVEIGELRQANSLSIGLRADAGGIAISGIR